MAQTQTDRKYLNKREAVVYLKSIGIDAATPWLVSTLIRKGQLPLIHVGKKHYVSREALDALLSKKERRTR